MKRARDRALAPNLEIQPGMRHLLIGIAAVSLFGCGVSADDPMNEPLDDEFAVDQSGLLVYPSTGEFEEEPPRGGFQVPAELAQVEELPTLELEQLPDATEVLDPDIDETLGMEEEVASGEDLDTATQNLVQCTKSGATGYKSGRAFHITVVRADYKRSGINAANAFYYMEKAAARAGVSLIVNSGFRTMAEQRYLYNCYLTKRCNNGNLAARPGYSNHQSGVALDISTRNARVYTWLKNNARRWGYVRTVPSEPWHWEYRGARRTAPCH